MLRVLAVLVAFALMVYSLADFATTDERDRGGIPGWLWLLIIVPLVYFGPLSWIVFRISRRNAARTQAAPTHRPAPGRPQRPGHPVAPDDDPDFLWRLAQEQRNQARKEAQRGSSAGTDPTGSESAGTDRADGAPENGHPDDAPPSDPTR